MCVYCVKTCLLCFLCCRIVKILIKPGSQLKMTNLHFRREVNMEDDYLVSTTVV